MVRFSPYGHAYGRSPEGMRDDPKGQNLRCPFGLGKSGGCRI